MTTDFSSVRVLSMHLFLILIFPVFHHIGQTHRTAETHASGVKTGSDHLDDMSDCEQAL